MTPTNLPPEAKLILQAQRQRLSQLVDGEAPALDADLAGWCHDAAARENWHTYHLIGDVMRSEDLASSAAHDQAFIKRFRARLDAEPVHLLTAEVSRAEPAAAAPLVAQRAAQPQRLARWQAGTALAASVAVVAVALLVSKGGEPGAGSQAPVLARSDAAHAPTADTSVVTVGSNVVLRDPRLDEFLRLHQMARGGLPVGAPGGSLQRADLQMPADVGR